MKVDVMVPELAESITEAIIGEWLKKPGDLVHQGDQLVDIETDKVVLEITAPESGQLALINKHKNELVESNEIIAVIDTAKQPANTRTAKTAEATPQKITAAGNVTTPASAPPPAPKTSPAVRKLAAENDVDVKHVQGSGKHGRITKQDIETHVKAVKPAPAADADFAIPQPLATHARKDKRVPMTSLRKNIARRLVHAQQETAMLTTFNEVNMQNVMDLRQRYKEEFATTHGVKLGFMSFFTKACVEALKEFPVINAYIEGDDIVYHNYFDIGIAVSTPRGLIVPVLHNADNLSFAGIELAIRTFAMRARDNKITIEELTGGTFTITNGGIFGSMLSTPIINPPQSAIIGMHAITLRPIAENGAVVIAPMMYIALSYDHRIIDGQEAVQFLIYIKNILEDPNRLLLQV